MLLNITILVLLIMLNIISNVPRNMMPIVGTTSVARVMRHLHWSSRGSSVRHVNHGTKPGVRILEIRHTSILETQN